MKRVPALILLVLLTLAYSIVTTTAGDIPDHITLTMTANPATTMTITWRTNSSVTTGYVQYQAGQALNSTAQLAKANPSDFNSSHLFTTTLTGLSPNTTYTYRVGDQTHWSGKHTFTTADPKTRKFKFLVFGDSQSMPPYALWRKTVHNAFEANPDARFFVNVGDLVDIGQNTSQWNAWFEAAAGVIDTIPAMPVVGNHETTGSPTTRRPAYWNAQFHLPQNGPESLKNQAYSYDYGPVHFVVLDSQQGEQKSYGNILPPQKKWLDADLASSKAPWKIVFFHKPPYSIKQGQSNKNIRDAFSPIIERHHVDLVFNGHEHGVSRSYPMKNGLPTQKGTIYYITGRSGSKFYKDLYKRSWNTFFYNPQDQPNYIVVEVDGAKLTVRTVKLDGSLVDTFTIDKNSASN